VRVRRTPRVTGRPARAAELESLTAELDALGSLVTNTGGSGIFDMIFATDHWAGEKTMTDLYSAAMSGPLPRDQRRRRCRTRP
jgi:hypothetical protein